MPTVNVSNGVYLRSPTRGGNTKLPYLAEVTLDYSRALALKGSALAAADVFEVIPVPPEHIILAAGAEVLSATNATTLTVGIGTGVATSRFVAAFDEQAAAVGAYTPVATGADFIVVGNTADTVDVIATTLTGTLTQGRLRVWALLLDISDALRPGIAQLGT